MPTLAGSDIGGCWSYPDPVKHHPQLEDILLQSGCGGVGSLGDAIEEMEKGEDRDVLI